MANPNAVIGDDFWSFKLRRCPYCGYPLQMQPGRLLFCCPGCGTLIDPLFAL